MTSQKNLKARSSISRGTYGMPLRKQITFPAETAEFLRLRDLRMKKPQLRRRGAYAETYPAASFAFCLLPFDLLGKPHRSDHLLCLPEVTALVCDHQGEA